MITIFHYRPLSRKIFTETGKFILGSLAAAAVFLLAAILIAVFGG